MVSAKPRQAPRVQGHQNGLLKTDRHAAKLPIHLDSIAKCLDINAKDYCHLRHSNVIQTYPLLIPTTIGDSWPVAERLVCVVCAAKADVYSKGQFPLLLARQLRSTPLFCVLLS